MTDASLQDIMGVRVIDLATLRDGRGAFTETFRQEWVPEGSTMIQSNLSRSRAGVLRGLHYHAVQADYWCVLEGEAFVAIVDLRTGSPTWRIVGTATVDAGDRLQGIYLPPGIAHGFCAVTDVALQYLVDRTFTGDDEYGVAWDDPDLAIDWPIADPILSERDRANPSLAEVLRDPPASAHA